MNEKEQEVYKALLEKIKKESNPDMCSAWASALVDLTDAIHTRMLHLGDLK